MTPETAAEAYWLRPLRAEDMPTIATAWINDGLDHSAVVRAASVIAADDPRDVRDLFVGALEGLGVWIPSEREARCRVVSRHAARLVEDLDNIEQVATSVTAIVHLDDVMYREIGDPWLGFARLCWSWFDDDLYMANGGEDELRRWAEQCALRPAGSA